MEYHIEEQDESIPQALPRRKRRSSSDAASTVEDNRTEIKSDVMNSSGTIDNAKIPSDDAGVPPSSRPPPSKPLRHDNVYTYEISCLENVVPVTLGVGQFKTESFIRQVKGRDDVYCRKESGVYFRVEQLHVGDTGLKVGDEVLVINGFKLESINSILAVG